jgi:hypothetical protein
MMDLPFLFTLTCHSTVLTAMVLGVKNKNPEGRWMWLKFMLSVERAW